MGDSDEFERIVTIKPAFDCLRVQPCVHGSTWCGKDPGASHGRHNAEMRMTLRGAAAEVTLAVGTGWDHPATPASATVSHHNLVTIPNGYRVEFHSAAPRYEGQEPQATACERWPTCYGDSGYTMASEPARLLVTEGSDAVWAWLEALHRESFPAGVPS